MSCNDGAVNDGCTSSVGADEIIESNCPVQASTTYPLAPTATFATHYKMNHPKRGMALIFDHEFFLDSGLTTRTGTHLDCEELDKTWNKFGFDVTIHHDLKYVEIAKTFKTVASMDHSDYDCLIITILTHGERRVLHAHDTTYKLEDLVTYFKPNKCPTLAGKPKLFFIQACQGPKKDPGVTVRARTETDGQRTIENNELFKIPLEADFLLSFATIPGYVSWRHPEGGSWYIQCLCAEINANGCKYDIHSILTHVAQRVSLNFETSRHRLEKDPMKQIPRFESRLTRMFIFPPIPNGSQKGNKNYTQIYH